MYRLAILPSIFVNILWYIFGKGQSGVPGRAGWRQKKFFQGTLPDSRETSGRYFTSDSLLGNANGGNIREGFRHSDGNQKSCLSTRLCHCLMWKVVFVKPQCPPQDPGCRGG